MISTLAADHRDETCSASSRMVNSAGGLPMLTAGRSARPEFIKAEKALDQIVAGKQKEPRLAGPRRKR